jgi:hypothetical protein
VRLRTLRVPLLAGDWLIVMDPAKDAHSATVAAAEARVMTANPALAAAMRSATAGSTASATIAAAAGFPLPKEARLRPGEHCLIWEGFDQSLELVFVGVVDRRAVFTRQVFNNWSHPAATTVSVAPYVTTTPRYP